LNIEHSDVTIEQSEMPMSEQITSDEVIKSANWQDDSHGTSKMYKLYASQLRPSGLNLRRWNTVENREKVAQLAESIFVSGVEKPLDVINKNGEFLIDDGETRWLAVRLLEGFDVLNNVEVPSRVEPDKIVFHCNVVDRRATDSQRLFKMMRANDGRPFTDLEYCAGFLQQIAWGVKQTDIARELGKPPGWVSRIVQLQYVPHVLHPYMERGQLKTTTVLSQIDRHGSEKATALILAEIEAHKAEAAEQYEVALREIDEKKKTIENLMENGESDVIVVQKGKRPLTKLAIAQQELADANEYANTLKSVMENGPVRVTDAAVTERANMEELNGGAPSRPIRRSPNRVSKISFQTLLGAVQYAATYSMESSIRDTMNDALRRCGFDAVDYYLGSTEKSESDAA
jgi:hypothetical protein